MQQYYPALYLLRWYPGIGSAESLAGIRLNRQLPPKWLAFVVIRFGGRWNRSTSNTASPLGSSVTIACFTRCGQPSARVIRLSPLFAGGGAGPDQQLGISPQGVCSVYRTKLSEDLSSSFSSLHTHIDTLDQVAILVVMCLTTNQ